MARRTLAATLAAMTALITATSALAHAGNPDYESVVSGVTPPIPGFSVQVLNGDDRLEVTNHAKSVVTIEGYNNEPFARMSPNGRVEVNLKSPAYYLDQDPRGGGTVPPTADAKAAPEWKVVAQDGRYQFHDHRIHWMGTSNPAQIKDKSKRTKVFDWKVPVRTASTTGAIDGELFWRGSSGGAPVGAFIGLALIVLLGGAAVVVVRRRRAAAGVGDPATAAAAASEPEPEPERVREEAW